MWSLHPSYLDSKGLVACWSETLLAQKVLQGLTKGWTKHPQLNRFRKASEPLAAVGQYLRAVADEADARGYNFDRSKIVSTVDYDVKIPVTTGQLEFEKAHLLAKLKVRDPKRVKALSGKTIRPHPIFDEVPGEREEWERGKSLPSK